MHIPVMLRFQPKLPLHLRHWSNEYKQYQGFYAMSGIKLYIPVKYEYESDITALSNAAYYPEADNWAATQLFAGLGDFDGKAYDGKLNLTPSFMLAFEAGLKWRLNNYLLLYAGAYLDFGLNNTVRNNRMSVRNFIVVDHLTDFTMMSFNNRTNIMAAGVRLRLAFFRDRTKRCPVPIREVHSFI